MRDSRTIFLTGFMGTGKSTVGRLLAHELRTTFLDLDDEIERQARMSIPAVFAAEGEAGFRRRERELLDELHAGVMALGGGALILQENRTLVRERGCLVALTASIDELVTRLHGVGRPLLAGENLRERIETLMRERSYEDADKIIDTTGRAPVEIAREIAIWIRSA